MRQLGAVAQQQTSDLVLCQVLELGLYATGFASAGRQYTTLMYTGTASGTPKLKLDTALAGKAVLIGHKGGFKTVVLAVGENIVRLLAISEWKNVIDQPVDLEVASGQ